MRERYLIAILLAAITVGTVFGMVVVTVVPPPSPSACATIGNTSCPPASNATNRTPSVRPLGPPGISIGTSSGTTGAGVSSLMVTLTGVVGGSGIVVFMGWQDNSKTPSSVGDGTNTYLKLFDQPSGAASPTCRIAVYASSNTVDHSMNVVAASYTITASLSGNSPDFSLYAAEIQGYGTAGRIYVTPQLGALASSSGSSLGPTWFSKRPSPDGLFLLSIVESGATFNAASPGTKISDQTGGAGTHMAVADGFTASTLVGATLAGLSWTATETYVGAYFEIDAIPAIAAATPIALTPVVAGSVNVYVPDFLGSNPRTSGHTSTDAEVLQGVPIGAVIAVFIHTMPGFAGSSANPTLTVTDSKSQSYTKVGEFGSGGAIPQDLEDVYATKTTSSGDTTVTVTVQQLTRSDFFNLWYVEIVSTGTVSWGTLAGAGGATGASGGKDSVTNAGLPAGNWLAATAGGIVSYAAAGSIGFTAVGTSPTSLNAPTQDTDLAPNFYQSSNAETASPDVVGATWSPNSGSDTWAVASLPLGAASSVLPAKKPCGANQTGGPVPPDLTSPIVIRTILAAPRGTNAYTETIKSVECLETAWVLGTPELYYANVTNLSKLASSTGTLLTGNRTWINVTGTCLSYYCFANQTQCDGLTILGEFPYSLFLNRPCSMVSVGYTGPIPFSQRRLEFLNVTVTRMDDFLVTNSAYWFGPNSVERSTAMNLTIYTLKQFQPTFAQVNAINYGNGTFLTAFATLVVPYPPGSWDLATTTVREYSNASISITTFTQTLTDVIVSWNYIATIQNITVSIFGTPTGPGYGASNRTTPDSITLDLENVTYLGNGVYQATATWTNANPTNFVGQINAIGTWVNTALNTSALVNTKPVGSLYTGTSVTILRGQVNVTNSSTAIVSVQYTIAPTFTVVGAQLFLNGLPISLLLIGLLLGILLAIGVYIWAKKSRQPVLVPRALMASVGVLMLTGIFALWFLGL